MLSTNSELLQFDFIRASMSIDAYGLYACRGGRGVKNAYSGVPLSVLPYQ